jgi:hypothetical protein
LSSHLMAHMPSRFFPFVSMHSFSCAELTRCLSKGDVAKGAGHGKACRAHGEVDMAGAAPELVVGVLVLSTAPPPLAGLPSPPRLRPRPFSQRRTQNW